MHSPIFKMFLWFVLASYMILFSNDRLIAQTGTIQGIVTDESNGQALTSANVVLYSLDDGSPVKGMSADRNGFFFLDDIQAGRYMIRISFIGYSTHQDTVGITAGELGTYSISLLPSEELLNDIVVSANTGAAQVTAGRQQISRRDLSRVPTPAGSGDLASYLQALPGVVTTGDRGGQLYVRGGVSSENLVLIDGTMIYQPFHIVGFFSAFPEELVSNADFYAGGFGPQYHSRISSVLDVQMRNGDRYNYRGSASASPFLAEILLEGPVTEGSTSLIVSTRHSLIESTSNLFIGEKQPLTFNSQYFKLSHVSDNNSFCSLTGMRTYDRGQLDFEQGNVFRWSNGLLGARCMILPEDSSLLFNMNIGLSFVSNAAGLPDEPERYSDATRFSINLNLTQYAWKYRFDYGLFTHLKWLNFDMRELFTTRRSDSVVVLGSGGYVEATIPLGDRIQIKPGALLSIYRYTYNPSFEPRFRFSWQPFGRDTEEFNAVFGVYRQPLAGINDMRDAGSAFTAWMLAPEGGSQIESVHTLIGWRQNLSQSLNISFETYYKSLRNMPITVWSPLVQFTTDLVLADGNIYGGDIRIEYDRGRLYGFAGYGFNWTEYESAQDHFNIWFGEPVQRFHPPHDRRHQINTMMSVELGAYTASVRWQLGSGLPYTQPMGFDELFRFDTQLPNVKNSYGTPRVILDRPYDGRFPVYHRLDLSLERQFDLGISQLAFQAGAINIYDQSNIFYYDVYTHRRINQLPFAPYFSLKFESR